MKRYITSNRYLNLTPIFAKHVRYDQKAAKILENSGLFDEKTSKEIIDALFHHDIHAFNHSDPWLEKYLKGIARMIVEESHGDPEQAAKFIETCPQVFNTYLLYIKELRDKLGGTEYDNNFINEMHYSEIENVIQEFNEKYYDDVSDIVTDENISGYKLIPINSYEEFHSQFGGHWTGDGKDTNGQYAGHDGSAWCHANDKYVYEDWTKGNKKFFVLAANNWKDIPFDPKSNASTPKDSYGNSLIAILVSPFGKLLNATLRCNHKGIYHGDADSQYKTFNQLSALVGFDVESDVKEFLDDSDEMWENWKYRLLKNDTITYRGHTLYRIQAKQTFTCNDIGIAEGSLGGYIESPDNLDFENSAHTCWVDDNAKVYGNAQVIEFSYVGENAIISGNAVVDYLARVTGNAVISGNAQIKGMSHIYGNARVSKGAWILGQAEVYDNAIVTGASTVADYAKVGGYAVLENKAQVFESAIISGNAHIFGKAKVNWHAKIDGNAKVYDYAGVTGFSHVGENAEIYDHAAVCANAQVFGNAKIYGNAQVHDKTEVYGNAQVHGFARILGNSKIHGDAEIFGNEHEVKLVDEDISYGIITDDSITDDSIFLSKGENIHYETVH